MRRPQWQITQRDDGMIGDRLLEKKVFTSHVTEIGAGTLAKADYIEDVLVDL